jgi:hypothetical protein
MRYFKLVALLMASFVISTPATSQSSNVWRIEFEDWVDDSLHWNAPSYLELNKDDGSAVFYAEHLANMRREGWLDQGVARHLSVTLEFWSGSGCTGEIIGTEVKVVMPGINYKKEYDKFTHRMAGSPSSVYLYNHAACVRHTQSWEVGW